MVGTRRRLSLTRDSAPGGKPNPRLPAEFLDSESIRMYAKCLIVLIGVSVTGFILLGLRQQRLKLAHEITSAVREMDDERKTLWEVHGELNAAARPQALRDSLADLGLRLEPVMRPTPRRVLAQGDDRLEAGASPGG